MKASQQKERLKQAIPVLVVGLLPILLLFFPYLTLTTREVTYQLSALQLLTAQGLEAGGLVATIPLMARIGIALSVLFPLAGIACYMVKRPWFALAAFALGTVSPIAAVVAGNEIARALEGAGLSYAAASPEFWFYVQILLGAVGVILSLREQKRNKESVDGLSETSLTNQDAIRHVQRVNLAKMVIAVCLGVVPVVLFFFPYMSLSFQGHNYSLSAWQILTAAGLEVNGALVTIPMIARIAVALGGIFSLCGIALLLLRRATWAGGAFVLSAVTPLVVLLSSSEIQTALTTMNITQIVVQYHLPFVFTLLCGLAAGVLSVWTKGSEKLAESIFLIFSCVSVGSVVILTVYMIVSGAPAIAEIGLGNFLFGTEWKPSSDTYGILPLILSSIAGTFGAVLIGVPIGILTAVFLSETAPCRLASTVRPAVQLLAGIPSVIYGFFGMLVILPVIRALFPGKTIGESLLAVILILAIMVLPTIVSVSENALRAVPVSYREAALALGTTPVKTIFKVTIPAAKSGILAGVILGVGRAIGETMAVIMVAGNAVNMPSLLGTVRLLTTGIVMEMSYSSGLHRQALFAIGLVLFIFIMIVNIAFTVISRRGVQMDAK